MDLKTPTINSIAYNPKVTGPLSQSILLSVIIILFGWFLVLPQYNTYISDYTALKNSKDQLSKIETDKQELNRLVSQLKSSQQEVKITDEALPLVSRITRLDVLIDTYAKSSGLQVAQINAEGTDNNVAAGNKEVLKDPFAANRSLQTTEVTVLVTGTVDQFKNFLQLLENSGRIIDVSSLDVTSGDGVTKFRIDLKAYSYDVAQAK